ncbi:uncharacterized protein LOC142612454 [Castanea sativa]|uniref:uncharacterized protein LOC142612454 n=1 Tax=Castanea sativa TaxID=21020 RepID=UPI003F64C370
MIMGGTTTSGSSKKARKTYLRMVQNIQLTGFIPKMARVDNPIIEFSKKDARCLHHPHDDALVVSIRVGDYNTYRVLVDNRSSVDILYYSTFQQMRIERERLVLTNAPLVVDCSSAYNTILGRHTFNSWKAVTSTYYLMIKFPNEYRVGEVRRDQVATRECYIAMLEMDNHLQTMSI